MTHTQFVLSLPCRTPKTIKSMKLAEKVKPIAIWKTCAITKAVPAKKTWTPNNNGATKIKVNSIGSVIPVKILVRAADRKRLPMTFWDSFFAVWYIANAAPGNPNIIKINSPEK